MSALCSLDKTDEIDLVARVRRGDEAACEDLVRRHTGALLAVARRFLGCPEESADAVQEAFLAAFRSLDSFEGSAALGTWLHRIVVNNCLGRLRSRKRRPTVSLDRLLPAFAEDGHHARPVRSWSGPADDPVVRDETRTQVRACIDQLPDAYRTVLLLRDIEEFDTDQTAAILGIAVGAVKTRLHRARMALRTLLEPLFDAMATP